MTAVVPETISTPPALLAAMFVHGGCAEAIHTVSLALLAEVFYGSDLVAANAVFETLYAADALSGAPLHGAAMDWRNPQGLSMSGAAAFLTVFLAVLFRQMQRARRLA